MHSAIFYASAITRVAGAKSILHCDCFDTKEAGNFKYGVVAIFRI